MCGGVEYIYRGEKKRAYFPNPQAHLPVRLKNYEIDYLPRGRRKQWIQGLIAHNGNERRIYVVTITPVMEDAVHDRWPRVMG